MRTVNIADLKNNLSAYLAKVQNGEELLVKDRNRPIARVLPLTTGDDYNAEEEALVAAGLMRLPIAELPESFWKMPAPHVSLEDIVAVIREERDED